MKTKLLTVALLASAALIAPVQGGDHHRNSSSGNVVTSGRGGSARSVSAGSFRSAPIRSFGTGRTTYSGQRFSSVGLRSSRSLDFRSHYVNSNVGSSIGARQFTSGNINRTNRFATRNINRGNNVARFSNTNGTLNNLRRGGNAPGLVRNGNRTLRSDWRSHLFAQRSGNWRNWDRSRDHWWNGHRCHFFNGAWFIFDFGFDPWWPYGYYPSDYYTYDYGYPYQYGYDQGYYDSGADSDQNNYADQSGDSNVAAVQQVLAQQGYYRGQIDGEFGPETRAALAEYQSNHGLRVTGTLTPDTLQALGLPRVASY